MDEKNWISIKDGLPKKDGEYLCTVVKVYDCTTVQIVIFANNLSEANEFEFLGCNYAGWYDIDSDGYYEVSDVVAWMELPKAYEEK